MDIEIISKPIDKKYLTEVAGNRFGDLVKAVVDIEREIMAIGGELHADEEQILLEQNSKQGNLWGINLYPEKMGEDFIEFDSMINIRPRQNNRSRGIEDKNVREKIIKIVEKLVK
jgi:hypothetical protein